MSKADIFKFIEALQANNSKAWMDANRSWYEETKEAVLEIIAPILKEIKAYDPRIVQASARKCLTRINNNLLFHPERPTYKDHFGIVMGYGKGKADFYIHLGLDELMLAGGLWHPSSAQLKKLRMEIDYEGQELEKVLNSPSFQSHFTLFQVDQLKNAPKGYPADHPHIEWLKLKSLAAFRPFSRKDLYSDHFGDITVESFKTLRPMLDFANRAIAPDDEF